MVPSSSFKASKNTRLSPAPTAIIGSTLMTHWKANWGTTCSTLWSVRQHTYRFWGSGRDLFGDCDSADHTPHLYDPCPWPSFNPSWLSFTKAFLLAFLPLISPWYSVLHITTSYLHEADLINQLLSFISSPTAHSYLGLSGLCLCSLPPSFCRPCAWCIHTTQIRCFSTESWLWTYSLVVPFSGIPILFSPSDSQTVSPENSHKLLSSLFDLPTTWHN